ncbi:MAG: hypothetical protein LQ340_000432 [Diploschistes diacapsis]|nr:MAG: hypothetical protein LQ340_000432 [Diploschistes diacapsis]
MSRPPSLDELPFEVLDSVVSNFESAYTLRQLSLTCKRFSRYVRQDGFRTFVQSRFPFAGTSSDWSGLAQSLVALSRAWHRKAFVARELQPARSGPYSFPLPVKRDNVENIEARSAQRQSMGYQPVLECSDYLEGNDQQSNRHLVTWAAGAELVLRVTHAVVEEDRDDPEPCWMFWKPPNVVDGRDDITSLNLLDSHQISTHPYHHLIVGRASGQLEHVHLSDSEVSTQAFDTAGCGVRSADTSSASDPLLAACLDGDVALFKALPTKTLQQQETRIPVAEEDQGTSTWTIKFLSESRLAVGRGPAYSALCVFDVEAREIRSNPLRTFVSGKMDSVYSIEPLLTSRSRDLFLTGWYSGVVTLHDLRCPENIALTYEDPIDTSSAIYSLCAFANDRFVAGSGRHSCVKVFDLRLSGSHVYASKDLHGTRGVEEGQDLTKSGSSEYGAGYNIFLTNSNLPRKTSPVYSLAKASPYSPSFYAGLENRVLQLDLYSLSDESSRPHARLPYANRPGEPRSGPEVEELATNLVLVEHTYCGAHSVLRQVSSKSNTSVLAGWDSRWAKGTLDYPRTEYQETRQTRWSRGRRYRPEMR